MKIGFIGGWGATEEFVAGFMDNLVADADANGLDIEVQYFPWLEVLQTAFPNGAGAGASAETEPLEALFHDVDILIGWSLGGLLALHTSVKNVVLLSSFVKFTSDGDALGASSSALQAMIMGLKFSQKMVIATFAKVSFAGDADAQKSFTKSCMSHSANELITGLKFLDHADARALLGGRNILILHGSNDKVAPIEMAVYTESIAKEQGASCCLKTLDGGHDLLNQHKLIFDEVATFYGLE